MNKILERQLKKVYGSIEDIPKAVEPLIKLISDTYDHADEDRAMIERSLEISSKELGEANERLRKESENIKAKLLELEQVNKLMIDRELKMIELKKRIKELEPDPLGSEGGQSDHSTTTSP